MFRSILVLSLIASPALAFTARNGVEVQGSAEQINVAPSAGRPHRKAGVRRAIS